MSGSKEERNTFLETLTVLCVLVILLGLQNFWFNLLFNLSLQQRQS